jgi:hypothetical protein
MKIINFRNKKILPSHKITALVDVEDWNLFVFKTNKTRVIFKEGEFARWRWLETGKAVEQGDVIDGLERAYEILMEIHGEK